MGFFTVTKNVQGFLIIALIVLFGGSVHSQSLGDPIVDITFGSGTATRSGALSADSGSTTYIYSTTGFPSDDYYTIANTTAGMFNGWWTTTDHTGNTGGYMMIVNGSYDKGTFYTRTVNGLCGSTTYQFAAWIKNLLNYSGILPNVTFSILTTDGTVLGTGNTGNIATGNTWIQYPFTFTTPANTSTIVIKMSNNANGGIGNDIAIDDITFRPYGAQITAAFDPSSAQSYCAGTVSTLTIDATTTLPTGYVQKVQLLVNGVWTDQSTAGTSSTITVPAPSAAGTYYYRIVTGQVSTISSAECVVASNQLTATVYATPTAAISVSDTTCLGSATVFTDKSASNNGTISAWLWDFGDGTTSTAQNPSHTYTAIGDYTVKLTVTNSNGCVSASTSKSVHISALPAAAFTFSTPDCLGSPVTITDQSTTATGSTIRSWLWNYGDGTTETKTVNTAFQHTYTTAGTYVIMLTVTNSGGCSASSTKSITISPLPAASFTTPDICLADASATFTNTSTIADSTASTFTYLWNFGDSNATGSNPNTSTLKNPAHKYTQAAVYQITLTVTSASGCSSTITKSFTVNGSVPVAAFTVSNSAALCSDHQVTFTNLSTVDFGSITKIEWYYDYTNHPTTVVTDNSPVYGKIYDHTYTAFHTPATQSYQVRMIAYSGGTCVSVLDKTITLLAVPELAFTAPAAVCLNGGSVQLAAQEVAGVAGNGVYTGTGVSSTGLFNPVTAGIGTFTINYIYTATNACADTISQTITVNDIPVVSVGPDITVLSGGSATLPATASGTGLTYSWSPATYLSSTTVKNPTVTPLDDITYTLTVTNSSGCSVSGKITVSVLKGPVVPNTFTPNGDGINDVWNIKYLDTYTDCTVDVFNRYGTEIFHSIGYSVPWDSNYNGSPVPVGVYYYIINPKHGRAAISGWVAVIR